MRARLWAAQHWTTGLALSWARASRMLTLVCRCWEEPRLPIYLTRCKHQVRILSGLLSQLTCGDTPVQSCELTLAW